MKDIIQKLNWRYATKQFDSQKKLSQDQLNTILTAGQLSPSSYGLQPWKFLVINNSQIRESLKAASWGQSQITDSSHLLVFCTRTDLNNDYIDNYVGEIEKASNLPAGTMKGFADMMKGAIANKTAEQITAWSTKQTYIALGMVMSACADLEIDSCPMEGFDASSYDKILGLSEKNLTASVVLPVGYRSSEDKNAPKPKFRFPLEEVVETIE
jgi:nitroreductase / dihydropteridine reductase